MIGIGSLWFYLGDSLHLQEFQGSAALLLTLNKPAWEIGQRAKSGPLPVFVNKVLLEHSHAHCVYVMSLATFLLQEQNYYVVVTETM